jgi:hypothetical protein
VNKHSDGLPVRRSPTSTYLGVSHDRITAQTAARRRGTRVGRVHRVGAFAASAVGDFAPIGPNQYFVALVNGKVADAVITVVCPFPPTTGEPGSPTPGQYVEVEPEVGGAAGPFGFTGSAADSVGAFFTPAGSSTGGVLIHSCFVRVAIPTTLKLPCSGSGVVTFNPLPGSATAHAATVSVTYGNVAG